MSLRNEQYRSLEKTKRFLFDLCANKYRASKPGLIRHMAADCLRHYPPLDNNGRPLFANDEYGPDQPPRAA
jgi:hypothetical protein